MLYWVQCFSSNIQFKWYQILLIYIDILHPKVTMFVNIFVIHQLITCYCYIAVLVVQ